MINIELIKDEIDLREFIGNRLDVRPKGKRSWALCPFHEERSPSFSITARDYHCYGCGASGDIFSFVMNVDKVSFLEASSLIMAYAGIPNHSAAVASETKSDARLALTHDEYRVIGLNKKTMKEIALRSRFDHNAMLFNAANAREAELVRLSAHPNLPIRESSKRLIKKIRELTQKGLLS